MNKEHILQVIKKNVVLVLPKLKMEDITETTSLKLLGANSLDRTEISIQSMNELALKIPLPALSKVQNIGDLVTVFYENHEK